MERVTLVLGLGVSGIAAAEFLLRNGRVVVGVDDNRSHLQNSPEIHKLQVQGLVVQPSCDPIDWSRVERLVVSPGISPKNPIYQEARKHQVPVIGEAELALPFFQKPLLAVTGTNGKTTVTLLTCHVLNSVGIKTKALGNVGQALCHYLLQPDDSEVFVVELSSFQLETMFTPVFESAVLLNITPDHLDRYTDMEAYAAAKCKLQYLMKKDAPFYVQEQAAREFGKLLAAHNAMIFSSPGNSFFNYRDMKEHDYENAMAAWALCQGFSVTEKQFLRALETFKKPPHRVEFVREIDGVFYYDDSKGTNIDAVIKAVRAMKGPVILIAGGVDKGSSYLLWKDHFAGKVKQIIAIGQAAQKIYNELNPHFNVKLAETLDLAVQTAADDAKQGDTVLLSPGCSSYDMFRDYTHRGEAFQHCVYKLYEGRRIP